MAVLELNCNNQTLEWGTDPAEMYAGNRNIDSIKFNFCELWDGFTKTAVFYCEKARQPIHVILDETNTCLIPPEMTEINGLIYIGVFGDKDECRRATKLKGLYLKEGIPKDGMPSEPTPDIYQQIINLCNEAVNTANSVREDADNGAFDGAKGDKGDKGDKGESGYTPVKGTDYWTETDKAEIKSYVEEAILGGAW